ncbi:DMT family transporter [Streptomyces sp. SID3343]|uniref:DMT family transporter n=1 Tax=Streptomyces sp. SID3343 TaxID=2690260 RepID=UPI00137013EE|nr:DMT family transporter [Streptomyces sp. SID3343]MYV98243.1 EamA family transporter [Streptomyces sp. SID3343]
MSLSSMSPRSIGLVCAASAQALIGAAAGVSAVLQGYPVTGGQLLRYALAAVVLFAVLRLRGVSLLRPTRRELVRLGLLALSGQTLFNLFLFAALDRADPATVGSVLGATPLLLVLVAPFLGGRRPTGPVLLAAVVVVAGAGLVQGFGGGTALGLVFACAVAVCEMGFTLIAVPLLPRLGAWRIAAYATAMAIPQMAVVGLFTDGAEFVRMPTGAEFAALVYLALPLTAGAFLLWYSALARVEPEQAGLFMGLVPVTAAMSGLVLGTGAPTPGQFAGALVVGVGVVIGMRGGRAGSAEQEVSAAERPDPAAARHRAPAETLAR